MTSNPRKTGKPKREPNWTSLSQHLGTAVRALMLPVESERRAFGSALKEVALVADELEPLSNRRAQDVSTSVGLLRQMMRRAVETDVTSDERGRGGCELLADQLSREEKAAVAEALRHLYHYATLELGGQLTS